MSAAEPCAPQLVASRSKLPAGTHIKGTDLMTRFNDFWPLYLQGHRHRGTRIGHYAATAIALSTIAASIVLQAIWLTPLGICSATPSRWQRTA